MVNSFISSEILGSRTSTSCCNAAGSATSFGVYSTVSSASSARIARIARIARLVDLFNWVMSYNHRINVSLWVGQAARNQRSRELQLTYFGGSPTVVEVSENDTENDQQTMATFSDKNIRRAFIKYVLYFISFYWINFNLIFSNFFKFFQILVILVILIILTIFKFFRFFNFFKFWWFWYFFKCW